MDKLWFPLVPVGSRWFPEPPSGAGGSPGTLGRALALQGPGTAGPSPRNGGSASNTAGTAEPWPYALFGRFPRAAVRARFETKPSGTRACKPSLATLRSLGSASVPAVPKGSGTNASGESVPNHSGTSDVTNRVRSSLRALEDAR